MKDIALDDFFGGPIEPPPRKEYTHYRRTITTVAESEIVLVHLPLVAAALHGDPLWAADLQARGPETFKPARYTNAVATIRAHEPIYMPWLSFSQGRVRVTDGRHRLYALLDEGYTHAKVVADPWHAVMIRTLADEVDGGSDDAGFTDYMEQQNRKS